MRPWVLDLCCGGGGFSAGLHAAGFNVMGVDLAPQPDYPFPFLQADALTVPLEGFAAIIGSPPCQRWSRATPMDRRGSHPDVLTPLRERLSALSVPWILENVPGAPMRSPVQLCGVTLRLGVQRHRLFESNVALTGTPCHHDAAARPVAVYGTYGATGGVTADAGRRAMGAPWLPWPALVQSIPPVYGLFLGAQLWRHVDMSKLPEIPRILAGVVQGASVTEVDHDLGASVTRQDHLPDELIMPRRRRSVTLVDLGRRASVTEVDHDRGGSVTPSRGDGSGQVVIMKRPGRPVAMSTATQGEASGPPCRHCQRAPVSRPATGRWARYCSHACRQAAYRAREAANGRRV